MLKPVETRPDSQVKRESVAEDLKAAGAGEDVALLAKAQAMLDMVAIHDPGVGAAIGVDLAQVKAAALRIQDVAAPGTGVRVRDSQFTGEITISNVRAGAAGEPPKKA